MKNYKFDADKYNSIFAANLRTLMENDPDPDEGKQKMSQLKLSVLLGCTRQQISNFCNGTTTPDINQLRVLSGYFDVTVDWLIGMDRNQKREYSDIGNRTGLTDKAISALEHIYNSKKWLDECNFNDNCKDVPSNTIDAVNIIFEDYIESIEAIKANRLDNKTVVTYTQDEGTIIEAIACALYAPEIDLTISASNNDVIQIDLNKKRIYPHEKETRPIISTGYPLKRALQISAENTVIDEIRNLRKKLKKG